jgi:hypothetical protein
MLRNITRFNGGQLIAHRPTPKLQDRSLSAICDPLFNTFAATLHIRRSFLHPQPEDEPHRGDSDPLMSSRQWIMCVQQVGECLHIQFSQRNAFESFSGINTYSSAQ